MLRPLQPRAVVPAAVVLLLAGACRESSSPTAEPTPGATLAASPTTVALSDSQPAGTLSLTTSPSGGRLEWQVTAKPTWLTVEPDRGIVSGITPVKLTATIPANAEPGQLSGRLELVSSGGAAVVTVTATVVANPQLALSAPTLAIAAGTDTGTVTISNPGRGSVSWTAASSQPWLTVVPGQGFLGTGQTATVRLVPNRQPLPAGSSAATVTFRSNARNGDVTLPVSVSVPPAPRASVGVGRLVFPTAGGTQAFHLVNRGKGTLTWRVSQRDAWLTVEPAEGQVAPGDSTRVTVRVAAGTPAQAGGFTIASDAVDSPTLRVSGVVVAALPPLGVRFLDHRVVDAEFSQRSGLVVTVSANPSRLNVLDVETGETYSVALPLPPSCVAVQPDGRFAAVGHDGRVSYVDLGARSLVRTYAVTSNAIDIVLPGNGHVYVFPRTDQWETIRTIDLQTGVETQQGGLGIYAGTLARLHPSGDFIYGANNGLSPSDFEKYDIRGGNAKYMYDSPYHGDYAFSGNLWISEDGTRLFARSGNIFRSSPVQAEDMRYAGRLAGVSLVEWAVDSRARNRIYVLSGAGSFGAPPRVSDVRVYESEFAALLGTAPIPQWTVAGRTGDFDGRFLFVSAGGGRLYLLAQALASYGLAQDWALVTLDAGALP